MVSGGSPNPVDSSIKALFREVPQALFRLIGRSSDSRRPARCLYRKTGAAITRGRLPPPQKRGTLAPSIHPAAPAIHLVPDGLVQPVAEGLQAVFLLRDRAPVVAAFGAGGAEGVEPDLLEAAGGALHVR